MSCYRTTGRRLSLARCDGRTLTFIYLEHGAHYAIGALAIIMLLSMRFHVPELVTGLIGIAFIGWALLASLKHRKQEAKNIIT